MGAPGIAIASAIAGWVNALLLLGVLVRRGHWGSDIPLLTRIPRLVLAAAIMAGAAYFAADWLSPHLAPASPLLVQAAALAVLIGGAAIIYFAVAFGIGGADIRMIRRSMKRGAAPKTKADSD